MQRRLNVGIFILVVTALVLSACASAPLAPVSPAGNLNAEQTKRLVDARSGSIFVDTRTEYEFRKGRIPGAINIPPHRFDEMATLLPQDKSVRLVFYCRGSG